jgi:hypothetical protein
VRVGNSAWWRGAEAQAEGLGVGHDVGGPVQAVQAVQAVEGDAIAVMVQEASLLQGLILGQQQPAAGRCDGPAP